MTGNIFHGFYQHLRANFPSQWEHSTHPWNSTIIVYFPDNSQQVTLTLQIIKISDIESSLQKPFANVMLAELFIVVL